MKNKKLSIWYGCMVWYASGMLFYSDQLFVNLAVVIVIVADDILFVCKDFYGYVFLFSLAK